MVRRLCSCCRNSISYVVFMTNNVISPRLACCDKKNRKSFLFPRQTGNSMVPYKVIAHVPLSQYNCFQLCTRLNCITTLRAAAMTHSRRLIVIKSRAMTVKGVLGQCCAFIESFEGLARWLISNAARHYYLNSGWKWNAMEFLCNPTIRGHKMLVAEIYFYGHRTHTWGSWLGTTWITQIECTENSIRNFAFDFATHRSKCVSSATLDWTQSPWNVFENKTSFFFI